MQLSAAGPDAFAVASTACHSSKCHVPSAICCLNHTLQELDQVKAKLAILLKEKFDLEQCVR